MRKYFRSLADVLASPIVAAANALRRDKAARQDRVLQSTKLEDMIYQGLHKDDDELIALEQSCTEKLSTFSALSRDIYQSFYSLRVRKREEESLSAPSRRFNVPILKELMDGDSYPTIKVISAVTVTFPCWFLATAFPIPTGPFSLMISISKVSTSPGTTFVLNFADCIPPK